MAWTAVTQFFKTFSRLVKWQALVLLAALLLACPTLLAHLFFWRIEYSLNLKVLKKPMFIPLPGVIHLKNASLIWPDYFRLDSGSLTVRYPVTALFQIQYPISLSGENLAVTFSPQLQKTVGQEKVVFDRVDTRLVIRSKRLEDIEYLNAESKTLQFHLKGPSQKR